MEKIDSPCPRSFIFITLLSFVTLVSSSPLLFQKHNPYIKKDATNDFQDSKFVKHFFSIPGWDFKKPFKLNVECDLCKGAISFVQELFKEGKTKQEIVDQLTAFCVHFGLESIRVCIAITREFENEVLTVIDKLALNPDEACGIILGSGCGKPYDPFQNWNVTFPNTPKPPVVPPTLPKPGSPKLRVLHLSDIHYDTEYSPGSNAVCLEPLCCRKDDGRPDVGTPGAGQWGDYRNCDTPQWTLDSLFQHLHNRSAEFDYVIWTGDLPAHDIWNQSRADQLALIDDLTKMFKKYLPDKKIYSALGNHDSAPVNSFPPPFINDSNSIQWLYTAIADSWLNWLPEDTRPTILKGSYYSVSPYPGLRLISINTNYCMNKNWWLLLNTTDPANQLQWLIEQLQTAENKKEKVHIIGHQPPGKDECLRQWSWNYYNIVNRYESTIVAQFFGHTHKDEFEIFYDNVTFTRPLNVAYISPSVTPYSFLNIGYRIFEVDGNYSQSSWSVLDHETYILNLTEANTKGQAQLDWKLEYTAKDEYGLKSLYPEDWNNLIFRLNKNSTLFDTYYRLYYKSNPQSVCDEKCKRKMLCDLRSGRSNDPLFCIDRFS